MMKALTLTFLVAFSSWLPAQALAQNSHTAGAYVIHYNALPTESLPASVARAYGIKRSKNRGLLNVSILKNAATFEGVEATIKATATNLTGQMRVLDMRVIHEQNAVYYISDFTVANQETLDFAIQVTTPDQNTSHLKLRQQFFAN